MKASQTFPATYQNHNRAWSNHEPEKENHIKYHTDEICTLNWHRQITVNFTLYLLLLWWDSLQLSILAGYPISNLSSLLQLREATPFWQCVLFPTRPTSGCIQLYLVYLGTSTGTSTSSSSSSTTTTTTTATATATGTAAGAAAGASATATATTIIIIIIIIFFLLFFVSMGQRN